MRKEVSERSFFVGGSRYLGDTESGQRGTRH